MSIKKKIAVALIILLTIISGVWIYINPIGKIGWAEYGMTVYSTIPMPITDFQARSDGSFRRIDKTHELTLEKVQWLLESSPEYLIIAIGWDGMVRPDPRIVSLTSCKINILKNSDAIKLYNNLKHLGYKVSIHYHSTC